MPLDLAGVFYPDASFGHGNSYKVSSTTTTYGSPLISCVGEIHVFGCAHATICKCGTASRVVLPPSCGECR